MWHFLSVHGILKMMMLWKLYLLWMIWKRLEWIITHLVTLQINVQFVWKSSSMDQSQNVLWPNVCMFFIKSVSSNGSKVASVMNHPSRVHCVAMMRCFIKKKNQPTQGCTYARSIFLMFLWLDSKNVIPFFSLISFLNSIIYNYC